jgi:transposase InsO family protein
VDGPALFLFLYLAMVLDVYARCVVGWAMETHLCTGLIRAALNMRSRSGRRQR